MRKLFEFEKRERRAKIRKFLSGLFIVIGFVGFVAIMGITGSMDYEACVKYDVCP